MGLGARDNFRTPSELVLQDRLLSLGCEPHHLGIETHNSGSQSNHFPHGVGAASLLYLLTALREHRDDEIVGALGPTVCESLWTWAMWPIPREQWAGQHAFSATVLLQRVWWLVLGDTIEEARRLRRTLEAYANEHDPHRPSWYRGNGYSFRGCWRELSPQGGRWPWSSLHELERWPLVFGAPRAAFEEMRAHRAGEGR